MAIKVTVWNEFIHEKKEAPVQEIYPTGIHNAIADFLNTDQNLWVRTATLEEPEHGLTQKVLDETDVLIWWGHLGHHLVSDEVVERVQRRVLAGMGLIVLHSGHNSKIFQRLMGTSCSLRWRENGDKERLWVVEPAHPVTRGLPEYFELPHEETYGERFDIPAPDSLVLLGWFSGGDLFRSGCCYNRGYGRLFYFQPGHETFPTFYDENVQRVILNAVYWAHPTFEGAPVTECRWVKPLEKLPE